MPGIYANQVLHTTEGFIANAHRNSLEHPVDQDHLRPFAENHVYNVVDLVQDF